MENYKKEINKKEIMEVRKRRKKMEKFLSLAKQKKIIFKIVSLILIPTFLLSNSDVQASTTDMLIDDFSDLSLTSKLGSTWRGVSDRVMGGVSEASISHEVNGGGNCLRLSGECNTEKQ